MKSRAAIKQIAPASDVIESGKSVECADGQYRPNWRHEDGRLVFLIAPGTPIIECPKGCRARVCMIRGAVGHFAIEHGKAMGHPLSDFYAPKHEKCKPQNHEIELNTSTQREAVEVR